MTKKKLFLGLILFGLGLVGVLSLLTMEIPLPSEVEVILKDFTPFQKKLLTLPNPILLLIISVTIGTILFKKVDLKSPIIERIVGLNDDEVPYVPILKYGVIGGVISGFLISLDALIFNPFLPDEFLKMGESIKPTLAFRFLYGGLTEEIFVRFGLMTLIVWITSKVFKGPSPIAYSIGIIVASLLFAIGHFPIAYAAVESPSIGLLIYMLIGNGIGGLVYGWLYWKKGLESAFLAHIFTHVFIVIAEPWLS